MPVLDAPAQAVPAQTLVGLLDAGDSRACSARTTRGGTTPGGRAYFRVRAPPTVGSAPCPGGAWARVARPRDSAAAPAPALRMPGARLLLALLRPGALARHRDGQPGALRCCAAPASNRVSWSSVRRSCLARTSRSTLSRRRCSSNSSKKSASRSITHTSRVLGVWPASCSHWRSPSIQAKVFFSSIGTAYEGRWSCSAAWPLAPRNAHRARPAATLRC